MTARVLDGKAIAAEAVVRKLLDESMFTAWGIRTMASTEKAYNPFSYHDGSVRPFENALIASVLMEIMDNPDELDIVIHPASRHRPVLAAAPAPDSAR